MKKFNILIALLPLFSLFQLNAQCEAYGKIVISEIHFDTRFSEDISRQYHSYGEYIELFNSSNTAINLTNWTVKDNHTTYTFAANGTNTLANLIIGPGKTKIVAYDGYEGFQGGSPSAVGGRIKFLELFPEIVADNGNPIELEDIVLQRRMVLYNDVDKVSLYNPAGKIIDEVSYLNGSTSWTNALAYLKVPAYTIEIMPKLENGDGGVFNGPIGLIEGVQHDEYKQSIYRSDVNDYYVDYASNDTQILFQIAVATPLSIMPLNVPLLNPDPFLFSAPEESQDFNQIDITEYNISNNNISSLNKTYFDDIGKPTVSLIKDVVTNRVWGIEKTYDSFGRYLDESYPAVTCFDMTKMNFLTNPIVKSLFLDKYYSDNNTIELYQPTATHPYSHINYDNLNPGNIINVTGGNQINGQWKTGFQFTVPAAQEMYYVLGHDFFDGPVAAGQEEMITKFYKNVVTDANGVENVSFTDGEGKLIAAGKSGGSSSYPVISLIGTQGFVDIHIPIGSTGTPVLIGGNSLYKVFDLKTGQLINPPTFSAGNGYRVVAIAIPTITPKVFINTTTGGLSTSLGAKGILYNVNYYDFAINIFSKTERLVKSIQPKGYQFNNVIVGTPSHMQAVFGHTSAFTYNTMGNLVSSSAPDYGLVKYSYRKDGQIRYTQNGVQNDTEVSYAEYDNYGRQIENGAITSTWQNASSNPDGPLVSGMRSEQSMTIYDFAANNLTSVAIPSSLNLSSVLTTAGISTSFYIQRNLSGRTAITFTRQNSSVTAISWYSYDVYGRVEWVVQYNVGLGAKTIDYEYDFNGNVTKTIFQKYKPAELFAHRYTFNLNDVLVKVETSTNNSFFITQADYSYFASGELKRVNMGQGIQGMDYVYTLDSKLKSINHPSLEQAKDPGNDANDVFGITYDYYTGDYLRTGRNISTSSNVSGNNQDFNSNVKAARWANRAMDMSGGVINQKAYLYDYDRNYWLQNSQYGTTDNTANITPSTLYREGSITYDANGNMVNLQRTNQLGVIVDNLNYNYNSNNQLDHINETAPVTSDLADIEDHLLGNYAYDNAGQLAINVKENLVYDYDVMGKVVEVKNSATNKVIVRFYYNERGIKNRKESFNAAGILSTTDYYVTDNSGNVVSIFTKVGSSSISQKELPVYGYGRIGVYVKDIGSGGDFVNYEICDHVGNVRAVIKKPIAVSTSSINSFADFYPFGEKLPLRNSNAGNYRYAFQGQEFAGEISMESFNLRLWDGRIGRWLNPDPKGQFSSAYLGFGNNPMNNIDEDGGWVTVLVGALIGAGASIYQQHRDGDLDWSSGKTWARIGVSTGAGALAGAGLGVAVGASIVGDVGDQYIKNDNNLSKVNYTNSVKAGAFTFIGGKLFQTVAPVLKPSLRSAVTSATSTKIYALGRTIRGSNYTMRSINKYADNVGIVLYDGVGGYATSELTYKVGFDKDYIKPYLNQFSDYSKMQFNNMRDSFISFKNNFIIIVGPIQ